MDNYHRQSPRRSGPLILAKATRFFMHFVFLGLQISTAIICSAVAGQYQPSARAFYRGARFLVYTASS